MKVLFGKMPSKLIVRLKIALGIFTICTIFGIIGYFVPSSKPPLLRTFAAFILPLACLTAVLILFKIMEFILWCFDCKPR